MNLLMTICARLCFFLPTAQIVSSVNHAETRKGEPGLSQIIGSLEIGRRVLAGCNSAQHDDRKGGAYDSVVT